MPDETRIRLSSTQTVVWKWLFPAVWSVGWGIGTINFLMHPGRVELNGVMRDPPPWFGAVLVAAWIIGTALATGLGWRLKRVYATADSLCVSNYLREIRIPLADIERVEQPLLWRGMVVIHCREPTAFGQRIWFLSKGRLSWRDARPRALGDLELLLKNQPLPALPARPSR